jgi:hypothetical protein
MLESPAPIAHHLPWYFGLAVVIVWAAAMVLVGLLAYRRWHGRLNRRVRGGGTARAGPDDRSLGPGDDLEIW